MSPKTTPSAPTSSAVFPTARAASVSMRQAYAQRLAAHGGLGGSRRAPRESRPSPRSPRPRPLTSALVCRTVKPRASSWVGEVLHYLLRRGQRLALLPSTAYPPDILEVT